MRTYPQNSPKAVARILAMSILADGNYSMPEIKCIENMQNDGRLKLNTKEFQEIINEFCHDLLIFNNRNWNGALDLMDSNTKKALFGEIIDAELQYDVMKKCVEIIKSDGHFFKGEFEMIDAMSEHWPAGSVLNAINIMNQRQEIELIED